MLPQFFPCVAQLVGAQHTFPTQTWAGSQVPQLSTPPHPSEIDPQVLACSTQVVSVEQLKFRTSLAVTGYQ